MQYNTRQYNTSQYQYFQLQEVITMTDVVIKESSVALTEFIFSNDDLTRQVTNKGLSDTVRTNDWIAQKQNPQSNNWGD